MGTVSWQAQIKGTKKWTLQAPPECYGQCIEQMEIIVEPGQISKETTFFCDVIICKACQIFAGNVRRRYILNFHHNHCSYTSNDTIFLVDDCVHKMLVKKINVLIRPLKTSQGVFHQNLRTKCAFNNR